MSEAITLKPADHATGLPVAGWLRLHKLVGYFALAIGISWLVELPLVAAAQGWLRVPIPFAIHYLAAFGPMLAALIMTWIGDGTDGLKELFGRITQWRVPAVGFLAALLSAVALFALSALVSWILASGWPDLHLLGQVNYLPYLGIAVLPLWLATYGFGEEIGWRGYALPRLQNSHSALGATLLLGALWALWHIPTFFYLDTYLALGLGVFPMFAFGILTGAIVLTWLYNTTHGSVLMVAIWHAIFDLVSAGKASDPIMQTVMSIAIMVWAALIVIAFGPANLARAQKHTV